MRAFHRGLAAVVGVLLTVALGSPADAVVCAAGAYHAGCASALGAVAVRPGVAVRRPVGVVARPVARPACVRVAGGTVCR